MKESAGRLSSTWVENRSKGRVPVEENKDRGEGWYVEENIQFIRVREIASVAEPYSVTVTELQLQRVLHLLLSSLPVAVGSFQGYLQTILDFAMNVITIVWTRYNINIAVPYRTTLGHSSFRANSRLAYSKLYTHERRLISETEAFFNIIAASHPLLHIYYHIETISSH